MEFVDAVREGDGKRILRCWRYFLLLFKATGRRLKLSHFCSSTISSTRNGCECSSFGEELSMFMAASEETSHVISTWSI